MSVKRAQREIDSREFAEWMAFSMIEPFGSEREDARSGIVASVIANVNRDPARRPTPYDVEDFFPRYEVSREAAPTVELEPEKLENKLRTWVEAMSSKKKQGASETRPKERR